METNYKNTSTPAFTANLTTKGIKLGKKKLNAVQAKFAQLTQHYKNDTFTLERNVVRRDNGQIFHSVDYNMDDLTVGWCSNLGEFKNWFNETPVDEIAKTLSRIFKAGKFKEIRTSKESSLIKNRMSAYSNSELNKIKAERNNNDKIYQSLADSQAKRAAKLSEELKTYKEKADKIENKIKDFQSNVEIYWE